MIVWKLSRFSRSLQDCVNVTTRIKEAGGRLLADDFDSANTGMANAMLGLLAGLAQDEREARGEGFREARARFIERGASNGRAPFGYRKLKDGRLELVTGRPDALVCSEECRRLRKIEQRRVVA